MMQVQNGVYLLIFLQLGFSVGANSESKGHTDRGIMERLSFGKMWYVYIKANNFDILFHTFRTKNGNYNEAPMPPQGVIMQMDRFKISRYPCQNLQIYFNESRFGLSQLEPTLGKSKICGSISRSFGFTAPSIIRQETIRNLSWLWQIHVNHYFIINVTFLSLESRFYPPCFTRRVLISETYIGQKRKLGVFCPNNPPQSFYSSGNNVEVNVHTWTLYEDFFSQNVYFNQWIGTVYFTYEILDNDLSFDPWTKKGLPSWNEVYAKRSMLSDRTRKLTAIHFTTEYSRNMTSYLFHIFESKGEIIYIFYFQSYLGATIAVREGSLNCTKNQVTLVAYEGPMVDMTRIESLLVRLQEWNCGHHLNATNHEEELKGRIGDMTVLFLVDKESTLYFYSLTLNIVFRAIELNPKFALNQMLYLESGSNIYFEQNGTYFCSIDIESVKTRFVSIHFDYISLRGQADQTCTYGGLYIVSIYAAHLDYIGGMCSHKAATRFQRLYDRHGLTLSNRVIIYIKQYSLLFIAHVKLRFSLDQCMGLVNLFYPPHFFQGVYIEKGDVTINKVYYAYSGNVYYRWKEVEQLLTIKPSSHTLCYTVHYINFDAINFLYALDILLNGNEEVIVTNYVENVRPFRMSMAFWNMNEELKLFDNCLANAFRFFPDNHNNEAYVLLKIPEEDSWVTFAFAAKIALDKTCLIFGGAFHLRVQKADSNSQCFSEVGGYLYDDTHPIIPKGVCGTTLVNLYHGNKLTYNRVSFQRPLLHPRCCYLNLLVMSASIPCIKSATAIRKKLFWGPDILSTRASCAHPTKRCWQKVYWTDWGPDEVHDVYEWSNWAYGSEMFIWRALCTKNNPYLPPGYLPEYFVETCIDLSFLVSENCDVNMHYRMSLLPYKAHVTTALYKAFTTDHSRTFFKRLVCHNNTCYFARSMINISWDGAQAECMKLSGTLVSVNSDAEWSYLTHNIILQTKLLVELIYTGYRTVSNLFTIILSYVLWAFPLLSCKALFCVP